ncbi:MAG: hypothetical protein KatS3mg095_0231 [Candidatus Parcubacteria bacterium]|nr:MAG: hypothetical protein KatS3mg095_0231 [Candidatus Parcubacteria bacterium]
MKNRTNKSQIILIITISLIISLGIIYISFLPLTKTLKNIKETTDYYRALEIANSGLEIDYLSLIPGGFDLLANTTSRSSLQCKEFNRYNSCIFSTNYSSTSLEGLSKYCDYNNNWRINNSYLNLERKKLSEIDGYNFFKIKINSQGVVRNKLANLNIEIYVGRCMQ